jgi:hypothetical protein
MKIGRESSELRMAFKEAVEGPNERGERSLNIRGKGIQGLLRIRNERRQVDVVFGWEMVEDGAPRVITVASPTAIRTQGVIRRAAIELAIEKPVDDVTVASKASCG